MEGNVATLEEIFVAAVEKAPADRAAYLDAACGSDAELRAQVEALLRSHERPAACWSSRCSGPARPWTRRP
jgi:hypothetical protein